MTNRDILAKIKEILGYKEKTPSVRFMEVDGRIRFFTTFSNCFKDAHSEIISSVAHEEYTEWVNRTKQYPQLWLWHAGPKSKWGQVDFIDYVDGFMVASGLVDADKAHIAKALEKEDLQTSHGFVGYISPSNVYYMYRTFEISPLPVGKAANGWTDFKVGDAMPFSPEQKTWLKDKANLTDEAIAEWEGGLQNLGKSLRDSGLEWKSADDGNVFSDMIAVTKSMSDVATLLQVVATKQAEFDTKIADFATKMADLEAKVVQATKDIDSKVEERFLAEVAKSPAGFKASESDATKVTKEKAAPDTKWFEDIINSVGM